MTDDDTDRYLADETQLAPTSEAISVSFAQVDSAEDFEMMAEQLRSAAEHCRVAAQQMLKGDISRGCTHGFAAEGYMRRALRLLEELTIRHADLAEILDDETETSE